MRTLGSGAPEPCPEGTASSSFQLVSPEDCPDCSPGFYCPELGTYNATSKCTEGFYCPGGDASPTRCVWTPRPRGTFGLRKDKRCWRNPVHFYLISTLHVEERPVVLHGANYMYIYMVATHQELSVWIARRSLFLSPHPPALSKSNFIDRACPAGHYCPTGSADPKNCVAGTYQSGTSAADCDICPDRYYCEATAVEALACPAGFYCPEGTEFATEFPCPTGTFSNETSLAAASECPLCPPGRFAFFQQLFYRC